MALYNPLKDIYRALIPSTLNPQPLNTSQSWGMGVDLGAGLSSFTAEVPVRLGS